MYTQRIVHIPAIGKNADLRAALLERNASGNADAPHALGLTLFSPAPAFVHSIRFDNLAALETYMDRPLDATFLAQGRKIDQCLAQQRISFLYEELAQGPAGVAATPKFLIRNRHCPAAGKGRDLRAVLEERVSRGGVPGLVRARLSMQLASLDGPAFQVTLLFASMADMEMYRSANQADSAFVAYQTKVASLSRTPMQQRIQRILANFPA